MTSVAVAVDGGGTGSLRAVKWAVENLMPKPDRLLLVHVIPHISSVPTPSGNFIPVEELEAPILEMYVQEVKEKAAEIFIPYKKLCKTMEVETLILEDDNPAAALTRFISESEIRCLVMGSGSSNFLTRKLKGPSVAEDVQRLTNNPCDIYVVSKQRVITKAANSLSSDESSSAQRSSCESHNREGLEGIDGQISGHLLSSDYQSHEQAEIENLREELKSTIAMYKEACDELVHAQTKVQLVSSICLEETRRVKEALEREETLKKIAAKEKEKQLRAANEVERARQLLAKETIERQFAEMNAFEESSEKKKIADAVFLSDCRYRRYTKEEIETATSSYSEKNIIGEGGYGKVYRCYLNHTPVAVKVLQSRAVEKKQEFLKEVEVLSQLHHPNIVMLLGACPESSCLVYEYMERGNLEDYIFGRKGRSRLPWFTRFRIIFEIACGLAFLHYAKPEPIVHRDLKPSNILLDRNYVSKIGDIGLAKLISDVVPDNVTEYGDSVIAGTLFYMDPEYQRTGTIRPKSDLFAFGIIILQLLTSRPPKGLLLTVENAIANGSLVDILDKSVTDWPPAETDELVQIALKCSSLRCRDRPDLDDEVLPALRRLADVANRNGETAPSHYYCPILQEIMDDPYTAADGFTYEYVAIKAWLDKHDVSPVTEQRLAHSRLTPNRTLLSAITGWRAQQSQVLEPLDRRKSLD